MEGYDSSMDVLVTGGAGFVGSNLARALLEAGHAVRVLDDLSTGRAANLDGVGVELIEGNIADPAVPREAVAGAEVVFHQAAVPSVARSVEDPVRTHDVNAGGTLALLVACRDAGVRRVVYASSSSVYGNTAPGPKHEGMAPQPRSPYAVAKLAGEHYCRAFTAVYGLETVSLRYFNVYGPRQDPDSGYAAVVPRFVTAGLEGRAPTIDGDGEQTRDFTYVDDVVEANLLAAAARDGASGETFNVAGGRPCRVVELWAMIAAATGCDAAPQHGPARAGDVRHSHADIARARRVLGYSPRFDLAAGLQATVAWFGTRPAARQPQ